MATTSVNQTTIQALRSLINRPGGSQAVSDQEIRPYRSKLVKLATIVRQLRARGGPYAQIELGPEITALVERAWNLG